MLTINRRQFLATSSATAALAAAPTMSMSTQVVPFVKPTTNILNMGARYGGMYNFTNSEILQIFGVKGAVALPEGMDNVVLGPSYGYVWAEENFISDNFGDTLQVTRDLAEDKDEEIYRRAQALNVVRSALNEHFNFNRCDIGDWLDESNPHLGGDTFRALMIRDIQQAADTVNFALTGKVSTEVA